jgi:hypothetical protein
VIGIESGGLEIEDCEADHVHPLARGKLLLAD